MVFYISDKMCCVSEMWKLQFWNLLDINIIWHYLSHCKWKHTQCSWVKLDQLHVTCFIISLFNAQHVSDVNTSILRSLRLICWVISWVVLLWFHVCWCYVVIWLWWCGIRMQASWNSVQWDSCYYKSWQKITAMIKASFHNFGIALIIPDEQKHKNTHKYTDKTHNCSCHMCVLELIWKCVDNTWADELCHRA